MDLGKITAKIRPRDGWEATDLGFIMVRAWWLPIYTATAIVTLPVAVIAYLVYPQNIFVALLIVWWLKPVIERIPLYIISRALFGETPSVRQALRLSNFLNKRTLRSLFTRCFDFSRSYKMPVTDLEQLTGKERKSREKLLRATSHGNGLAISLLYPLFELLIAAGLFLLFLFFHPDVDIFGASDEAASSFSVYFHEQYWLFITAYIFYVVAMIIVTPLYVSAGFSQYINRRTYLEAWDIELDFRRLIQRQIDRVSNSKNVILILVFIAAISSVLSPDLVLADSLGTSRQNISLEESSRKITNIMKTEEFNTKITVLEYKERKNIGSQSGFSNFLATTVELVLWFSVAAAIALTIFYLGKLLYLIGDKRKAGVHKPKIPETISGLDIRKESLPADIVSVARKYWVDGEKEQALSILYRGALSNLVNYDGIQLTSSSTEDDCVQMVSSVVDEIKGNFFRILVINWQHVAYADRRPEDQQFSDLCNDWSVNFGTS